MSDEIENMDKEVEEEVKEVMANHDVDKETAEHAIELIEEGLDEDDAVEIAEEGI